MLNNILVCGICGEPMGASVTASRTKLTYACYRYARKSGVLKCGRMRVVSDIEDDLRVRLITEVSTIRGMVE